MPEREAGVADRAVDRLRVAPRARPGRGVADVADREVTLERREAALVEHLRDEAHVLDDGDGLAVAHRDAGRLLAPVLQRVETEVGEVRHGLTGRVDAEDATGVADLAVRIRLITCRSIPDRVNPDVVPLFRRRTIARAEADGQREPGWPRVVGMASRQACGGVGEGDRERAVGDEAVAAGRAEALRRDAGGAGPRRPGRRQPGRRDESDDPRRRLGEPRERRHQLGPERDRERRTPPAIAISASATASPPSEHVVHAGDHAPRPRARATSSCSARRASRSAAGGVPPSSPCTAAAHSEPPSSARGVAEQHDGVAVARARGPGGTDGRARRSRPTTPTTGVGSMSRAARLVVEAHVAADDGDAERARTPRSCRRRPRRTATSPRGAPGCRS